MMNSSSPFASTHQVLRLRPVPSAVFDLLSPIQRLYLHARNTGAELAAIQSLGIAAMDEDGKTALFPEGGLNLSFERLAAIHAVRIDKLVRPALAVEFDFQDRANGLSVVALDESPDGGGFVESLHALTEARITAADLTQWRSDLDPPPCLCPHCSQAAERRLAHAASHPLTAILEEAVVLHLPLLCRLQSQHLGMVTNLIPGRVKIRDGCIETIDASRHGLLQIKLEYAHSLWVLPIRIDGETWSAIRVYDMMGQLNLEIASPDPALEARWRLICEGDSTHYRADTGL
ncbi:hypothetical protein [Luteolibacter sp. LG18]|uniref:hypothetical protein n=1 Tax=Luteolibacter sp. LG18 TaxID=2819286 RepID=UPI002B2A2227|nr:hypothetical protein llg_28810 [Luteolibacter sp. LG18]